MKISQEEYNRLYANQLQAGSIKGGKAFLWAMLWLCLVVAIAIIVALFPDILPPTGLPLATQGPAAQPTRTRVFPTLPAVPAAPPAQDAIDNYNATQEAQWVELQPVENVGQGEPAVLQQRAAPERLPAGEGVPTALPLPQTDGQFGSKSTEPVNILKEGKCLHGQVWMNPGCRNPTPVGGG